MHTRTLLLVTLALTPLACDADITVTGAGIVGSPTPAGTTRGGEQATSDASTGETSAATTGETSGAATTGESETSEPTTGFKFDLGDDTSDDTSDDTGPDTTSDASTGAATTGDAPCIPTTVTHATVAPRVVLVVERSFRMRRFNPDVPSSEKYGWDSDDDALTPNTTLWAGLRQVLAPWVLANDDRMSLGLALFPGATATNTYGWPGCLPAALDEVEYPVPANGPAIAEALPTAEAANQIQNLKGGTATATGMNAALATLSQPGTPRAMILISAAAPNCGYDLPMPQLFELLDSAPAQLAGAAFQDGIKTHVIAVGTAEQLAEVSESLPPQLDGLADGVSAIEALDQIAAAGGTASARAAHNEAGILAALDDIAAGMRSCLVKVDGELGEPALVSVKVAGENVEQIPDCDIGSGWVPSGSTGIRLCGAACEAVKLAGEADVTTSCM